MSIEGISPVPLGPLAEHPHALTVGTVTAQYKVSSPYYKTSLIVFRGCITAEW